MNVTVFGATGAVGQFAVAALLDEGDRVTAYVRNPFKVPPTWRDRVTVIVGEITDPNGINRAVAEADAVVSTLGPTMDRKATGLPLVEGNRLIVDAMTRHGVTRYIGNATPSVLDVRDDKTFQTRFSAFAARAFLRRGYDEMVQMSAVISSSALDWTIVRFMALKDGEPKGIRRKGFFGHDSIGFAVTRADIGAFTAAQVRDDTYLHAAPAISN